MGKIIAKQAAQYLIPTVLELGGKSPCIVDGSTSVNTTAKRILMGKTINAGQTCVAPDYILATLCSGLVNRQLFKIEISKTPFTNERIHSVQQRILQEHQLSPELLNYFIYSDVLTNRAYNEQKHNINLLLKNGHIMDLSEASDNLNISALSTPVEKYFLCYPR